MERVVTAEEVRQALQPVRRDGMTVALVPTMGALHEGHLSLVRAARARADYVVVSIFVNPTQFGPNEDFDAYPRDVPGDLATLEGEDVDLVFTPAVDAMYPAGAETFVEPGALARTLEGAVRPGHFRGVCTIVSKLFNIVEPDLGFFGEKDYQQLAVIRRMVADLDFGVRVFGCPIVRESDGLARSSRNVYLSPDERSHALVLSRALAAAQDLLASGETDAEALRLAVESLIAADEVAELDYAAVVDAESLGELTTVDREARALVAARFGSTRLIDNAALVPSKPSASASAPAQSAPGAH